MSDTHVYKIGNNLYLNLTNRCTNRCTFCVRDQSARYEGYSLWLEEGEPDVDGVWEEICAARDANGRAFDEVVFCGYGEPTYRLSVMLELCKKIHAAGMKTRLNTNGHGNVINGRNIVPELVGRLDGVNISLNAPDEAGYNGVCRPQFEHAFEAVLSFARECKRAGLNARFSVVDCIGEEAVARCKSIADEAGIPLRVREMIDNGSPT